MARPRRYPKEYVKSDGRKLHAGGPRDLQKRQDISYYAPVSDSGLDDLREEIKVLKAELRGKSVNGRTEPTGYYTAEQVDEEIRMAVERTMQELKNSDVVKLKNEIKRLEEESKAAKELKQEIAMLKQVLVGKEEVIETLRSKPAIIAGEILTEPIDPDRPKMEQKFIDPIDKDAGKDLKPFIEVKDIKEPDERMGDKVDKLKNLIGSKLPK